MRVKIAIALLLSILGARLGLQATHYLGASITYKYLNATQVQVDHWAYHSCQGINGTAPAGLDAVGIGSGCSATTNSGWVLISSADVTMLTPTVATNCTSGSPIDGVRLTHYRNIFDFTGATCSKYKLVWGDCCRPINIANISNSTSVGIGIHADTIRLPLLAGNNSPVWKIAPPRYALSARVNHFDLGATDIDGDSLAYSWSIPLSNSMTPVAYNLGYSLANPMGSGWNVQLNAQNGLFTLTPIPPASNISATLALRCTEYRGGVAIGSIVREFTMTTLATLPNYNALPTLAGPSHIQGGVMIGGNLVVPPGGNLCMDFTATDPDVFNGTNLSWLGDLPGATLTDTFGIGPDTVLGVGPWARLCYTAPSVLRNDSVTITAVDTVCQLNNMVVGRYGFMIGDTSLVWPGDADNNLVADAFDLLPIGLAWGNNFNYARAGASNSWVGQPSVPWQRYSMGAIDMKFSDCNGDSLINDDDTLAINLNYGLTHTKAYLPVARGTTIDPPFHMILPDSANVGDTISAPIILGDNVTGAVGIYGYAFRLNYDPTLIDSSTFWIEYSNSWLGNASNSLHISRNVATNHMCDGAQVRKTQTAVSGMGEVARAHFVIIDNIDGKMAAVDSARLHMFFSDVRVIGPRGAIIPIDALQDSMMVYDQTVDLSRPVGPVVVDVFPNPAHDLLTIKSSGAAVESVQLLNLQGQVVMQRSEIGRERMRLDVSELAQGMYFVRVQAGGIYSVHQVVLQ